MTKAMLVAGFSGALLLVGSAPASAADRFEFDHAHTNIVFLVDHLGFSRMIGQFQDFDGHFLFDPDQVGDSAVSVTIRTASVDTDHEKRDDHLRSPDFFNAVEFPEMTFRSTGIEVTGEKTGRISGDLTLLGVTRPVVLEVTFNRMGPHPSPQMAGVTVAGFSGRTMLRRSEFGMTGFSPGLGDKVEIWLEVEGHHKK